MSTSKKHYQVFLAFLLLICLFFACNSRSKIYLMAPFDAAKWKGSVTDRSKMVNDLCKNHLYVGMTKTDIEKLLGTPSRVLLISEYSQKDRDGMLKGVSMVLSYELPLDDYCLDSHNFNVHLDTNDKYIGYHIISD